jgi:hypothetical protein
MQTIIIVFYVGLVVGLALGHAPLIVLRRSWVAHTRELERGLFIARMNEATYRDRLHAATVTIEQLHRRNESLHREIVAQLDNAWRNSSGGHDST